MNVTDAQQRALNLLAKHKGKGHVSLDTYVDGSDAYLNGRTVRVLEDKGLVTVRWFHDGSDGDVLLTEKGQAHTPVEVES